MWTRPPLSKPQLLAAPMLAEQVVAAELAYYRQLEQCVVTEADRTSWHRKQALLPAEHPPTEGYAFPVFARHVLERHHRSLYRYLARQLSVEAWAYWFRHRGLVPQVGKAD